MIHTCQDFKTLHRNANLNKCIQEMNKLKTLGMM